MNTRPKRLNVYYAWTAFKELSFSPSQIAALLNRYQVPLLVYLGKRDRLVAPKHVNLILKLTKKSRLHLLDASHTNLLTKLGQYYQENLLQIGA
jgi:hypothetical protein